MDAVEIETLRAKMQSSRPASPPSQGDCSADDEVGHLQADGYWGSSKGFQDAEELQKG